MKKILSSLIFAVALIPAVSFAQAGPTTLNYSGLVKCDGVVLKDKQGNPVEQDRYRECNFAALMLMVNSIVQWIFMLTIPIFIILLAYAGFLYMTPSPGNREKSNKMLWAALKGFVIMLIAWFAISTLLDMIISDEFEDVAPAFLNQK
jgi:hypothetical protein